MDCPVTIFTAGDAAVKDSVLAAAEELASAGAEVEEFVMPLMDFLIPAYYIIACAEASSNLSRFDGIDTATGVQKENAG